MTDQPNENPYTYEPPRPVPILSTNDQAAKVWQQIGLLAASVATGGEPLNIAAFLRGLEACLLHLHSILAVVIGYTPTLAHDDLVRLNNRHLVDALRQVTAARGHYEDWRANYL